MTLEEEIYTILCEIRPENDFKSSKNFIEEYLLDSLDIIELVSLLEEKYSIEIVPDKIVPENFTSIAAIAALINMCKI